MVETVDSSAMTQTGFGSRGSRVRITPPRPTTNNNISGLGRWARGVLIRQIGTEKHQNDVVVTKSPEKVPEPNPDSFPASAAAVGAALPGPLVCALSPDPVQAERQRIFLDYYSWSMWAQDKVRAGLFVTLADAQRMDAANRRNEERDRSQARVGYGDE